MREDFADLLVVGSGPAGLSAAIAAKERGVPRVLVAERNSRLGGILPQCIHGGFTQMDITGPQYAQGLIDRAQALGVQFAPDTAVLSLSPRRTAALLGRGALAALSFGAAVLAVGCRERPVGALDVCGTRPSGVMTAGTAQQLMNLGGYEVGHTVVVLGSGDIGLIMARRFTLHGRRVAAVVEQAPRCGGLERNRVSCLERYGIPLLTSCTVTTLHGFPRLTGVTVRRGDSSTFLLPCDTLITAVGLIPETELAEAVGSQPWLFSCGNARVVHPLVESAAADGTAAGRAAAEFLGHPAQT